MYFKDNILKPLFENNKVVKIADLYKLDISDLIGFKGIGEKSARKALDNLFNVKEVSLTKFIAGFDIEFISEELIQRVVDAGFNTLTEIKNATVYQLSQVNDFGETRARFLSEGVNKLHSEMLEVLSTNKIEIKEGKKSMSNKLDGASFCFTGALESLKPRSKAEELVIENGGTVKSGVTKDLSYLVTNSTKETEKYLKAQQQEGTEIITEEEFLKMIE